ncbi:hypothetical protein A0H81_05529 [Grifola frondosa]|uniref:Uncharacterized protein n=1 Tax=Grifola frondosa TaxID=5627 RepID=A0A1C7MD13_GRIFR|nr:hypothetical protein A0H81_05529 [Grifola frondosa]
MSRYNFASGLDHKGREFSTAHPVIPLLGTDASVEDKLRASEPQLLLPMVNGQAAPVLLSADEWPGVQRAATDFASDIQQVTGLKPPLSNVTSSLTSGPSTAIIVGTLGKSSLINEVVNRTKLDVSSIQGQWEAFMATGVSDPLPGVKSAYVIIGADKRGTIFALYDHSEQFGVSPWYWWADVPTTKSSELFVTSSGCSHGSSTVQYRAIFLNDEQPPYKIGLWKGSLMARVRP